MMQSWENGKNPNVGSNLGLLKFFPWVLDNVPSFHPMQFPGKPMSQIWKNDKKPTFMTHFGPYGPNLGPQFFLAGFISTSS